MHAAGTKIVMVTHNLGQARRMGDEILFLHQGRLAERAYPARLVAVGISDVPGDNPAVIGSGPTVPDPTTLADARAILERYRVALSEAVP